MEFRPAAGSQRRGGDLLGEDRYDCGVEPLFRSVEGGRDRPRGALMPRFHTGLPREVGPGERSRGGELWGRVGRVESEPGGLGVGVASGGGA